MWTQLKNSLAQLSKLCLVALFLVSIAGYLGGSNIALELLSHFRIQYLVLSLLAFFVLLFLRQYIFVFLALLTLLINAYDVIVFYKQPATKINHSGGQLKVLLSNVYSGNEHYEKVIDFVGVEKPDIFVALEVNQIWMDKLDALKNHYPYNLSRARNDNFGIAVFSKIPLDSTDIVYIGDAGLPSIKITARIGEKPFALIATHPLPPVSTDYFNNRNQQLDALAVALNRIDMPKILIGDLNITMWSHHYQHLEDSTSMKNTRLGYGVVPTWPKQLPILAIPIDHCLVSDGFEVLDMRAGPDIGSDHLPVVVQLAL